MNKIEKKHLLFYFFITIFFVIVLKYLLKEWIFQTLMVFLVPLLMVKIFYLLGDFVNETINNSFSNFAKSFNFKKDLADKNLLKGLTFLKDRRNEKITFKIFVLRRNIRDKKIFNYIFRDENDVRYEIFNVSYVRAGGIGVRHTKTAGRIVANINLPNAYALSKDFYFWNYSWNLEKEWSKVELESNDFNRRFNLVVENYSAKNQTKLRKFFDPKMVEIFMDKKLNIYQIEIYNGSIIVYLNTFPIQYDDLRRLYNALQVIAKKVKKIENREIDIIY